MYVLEDEQQEDNAPADSKENKERLPPKETEEEAKKKRAIKYHEKKVKKIKKQMEKDVVAGKNASILDYFTDLNGTATKNNNKMAKRVLKARKDKEKRYQKKFEPKEKKFPTPEKMNYAPVDDWHIQDILLESFSKNERPLTNMKEYYEDHLRENGYKSDCQEDWWAAPSADKVNFELNPEILGLDVLYLHSM